MDILRINGLQKRFGDKIVLDGLELAVPRNSIFGFIGKNGAGKTTTMKTVLGLLQADAGDIYVDGEKVSYGQTPTNRHIGYLPDVPEFYAFMTAPEYLHFCGQITGMKKNGDRQPQPGVAGVGGFGGRTSSHQGFFPGHETAAGHCPSSSEPSEAADLRRAYLCPGPRGPQGNFRYPAGSQRTNHRSVLHPYSIGCGADLHRCCLPA